MADSCYNGLMIKNPLLAALKGKTAIPAFNFYNLESLRAIISAADAARRPVILAATESAMAYMGDDFLSWVAARICGASRILHLDHGRSFESCKRAITLGFQSVMIDGAALPWNENVRLTRRVVEYAHKHGVLVEAELGAIGGAKDGVDGKGGEFTDPAKAKKFVESTGCDWLAVAIGTTHGAYKGSGKLRMDILEKIHEAVPKTPLVLHGASQIPPKYARALGLAKAAGIPAAEIRRATKLGVAKVNIDSDARLAWTATMKQAFAQGSENFDPRHYLALASSEMIRLYKEEIKIICGA